MRKDSGDELSVISNPIIVQHADTTASFLSNVMPTQANIFLGTDENSFYSGNSGGLEESGQLLLRRNEIIRYYFVLRIKCLFFLYFNLVICLI